MPIRTSPPEILNPLSEGLSYVYVFPCAYEDLAKLGFSRDPLTRLETLHPRYYEFFDLQRGFLIETGTVAEARRLELELRRRLVEYNAPMPLTVRSDAGGRTEWYRGAFDTLQATAERMAEEGSVVHRPLATWLRDGLLARRDLLYARSCAFMEGLEGDADVLDRPGFESVRRSALDTLDAYAALDLPLAACLPAPLMAWYSRRR